MSDRPPPVERGQRIPSVTVDRSGRGLGNLFKPVLVLVLAAGLAVSTAWVLLSGDSAHGFLLEAHRVIDGVLGRSTGPAPDPARATASSSSPTAASGSAAEQLHAAVIAGDRDALEALLMRRGPADLDTPVAGKTALMHAATHGRRAIVRRLLDAGANPNARGSHQRTALQYAVERDRKRIAALLLDAGADIDGVDDGSLSPLVMAADRNFTELALMLIERGANVNIQNVNGWTALIDAARANNATLVEALLAAGAETGARHRSGWTALDFARSGKHDEVAALLSTSEAALAPATTTRPATSTISAPGTAAALPAKKGTRQ